MAATRGLFWLRVGRSPSNGSGKPFADIALAARLDRDTEKLMAPDAAALFGPSAQAADFAPMSSSGCREDASAGAGGGSEP